MENCKGNLLDVENLHTIFHGEGGDVKAVNGASFSIDRGKVIALVGESGSGKSVTALSLMGLLPQNGEIVAGTINYEGKELTEFTQDQMRELRGRDFSMIFQEPMTSLNPALRIGKQIEEVFRLRLGLSKQESEKNTLEMLKKVEIPNAEEKIHAYPHELSGGQKQRVMIAMALASKPNLLIADEPTTALDVTVQKEILRLMLALKDEYCTSILFITHDLGVVAEIADEVCVLYGGRILEKGTVFEIFDKPKHPYTQGLLISRPLITNDERTLHSIPGNVPNPKEFGDYCPFYNRCPHRMDICQEKMPDEMDFTPTHMARCFLYEGGMK